MRADLILVYSNQSCLCHGDVRADLLSMWERGERRMLGIGRGLMTGGRILLVDEPSLGLAPIVIDQIYAVITRLRDEGRTILLVEENVSRVSEIAESIHLLDNGSFVWQGPPEELRLHQEILETYLGG